MEIARERRRDRGRRRSALPERLASLRPAHDRDGASDVGDKRQRHRLGRQADAESRRKNVSRRRRRWQRRPKSQERQQQTASGIRDGRRRPNGCPQAVSVVHQNVRVRQAHVHVRHHSVLQVRAEHVLPDQISGRHGGGRQRDAPDGQRGEVLAAAAATTVVDHNHRKGADDRRGHRLIELGRPRSPGRERQAVQTGNGRHRSM